MTNSSVHQGEVRWNGSTSYSTEWDAAVSTWNSENAGNEIITVAATSSADLTVTDTYAFLNTQPAEYKPKSVDPVTLTDEIILHNWEIDVHQGYSTTSIQNITTHELGHALGLGHSVPDNVMYETVAGRTELGDQDMRDYHFLWTIITWAYQL